MDETHTPNALITNDAVIFGIIILILAFIFKTSSSSNPYWKKFYKYVPMLLLCYFIPSLLNTFGVVHEPDSRLYFVASRYLLPASLVLLTLSIDLKEFVKLGPKSIVMFFTATIGVVIGGPLSILIVSSFAPEVVGGAGPEAVWRGMATIAGTWIGGGANQAAMYEIFQPSDRLYSIMVTVDIIVAEAWMFFLLLGVGKAKEIDKFFKADASSIEALRDKMEHFSLSTARIASLTDLMVILGIAFLGTAIGHFLADIIAPFIGENAPQLSKLSLDSSFFWLVVIATTFGLILSFTKWRKYEGAGASKVGSVFIFILVATIGMKMDIKALADNPALFMVGGIWMAIHVILLFVAAKIIKAPYFFIAVGSKANIGGAASAPVVAAAFHPSLAPVGVLLAVFGYALGTYGAYLCGLLMEVVAP
ncbi:DUF819 family protein [Fulvivirgaceae bacterium BMA10]|uniref:DUF819 family protein n=1 Tax=Splendidivirga corallicola TaxID=3051826 RepID=A0ABT8KPB8_9BACT|nr:DUF819 family protein [Fulvivirgaceae bacterium BMA10]